MAQSSVRTEDNDMRLTDIFDEALELYEKIIGSDRPSSDPSLQRDVKTCVKSLEEATHLINAAALFSSNEGLEDIPTTNLKFLLIPSLLGILVLKTQGADRINVLETAEIYFKDFIKRIQEYGIIVEKIEEEKEDEEKVDEIHHKKLDLHQLAIERNMKIEKYKLQKKIEEELKRMKSMLANDDDELHRNYYLLYIKHLVSLAQDELKLIIQEKPLAKHLAETRGKGPRFTEQDREKAHCVQPLQAVIITRNELQKKVFGAGYPSLPTMTVEEFYKERVAEGIFPAHGSNHGKVLQEMTDPEKVKAEEEKEEVEKEEKIESDDLNYLNKARDMDEYKDNHRRGWGNRMNRS